MLIFLAHHVGSQNARDEYPPRLEEAHMHTVLRTSRRIGIAWVLFAGFFSASHAASPPIPRVTTNSVLGEEELILPAAPSTDLLQQQQSQPTADDYRVRMLYVVPSNRSPQPDAEKRLQQFSIAMQSLLADRMELLGYPRKKLRYETEADGRTPRVDTVSVAEQDADLHGDFNGRFFNVVDAVNAAGHPAFQPGEVLLVVVEMQVQLPDGTFLESSVIAGGTNIYSNFSGVGMVSGDFLARLSKAQLLDNRPYDGLLIPAIGPYPLVQDFTFAWFEGTTVSSISSSAYGAALHELGHGFGLWHDFRNDANFNGNLMGNGLRGIRGALFPNLYPDDDTRLATGSALLLNYSRHFNQRQTYGDDTPPEAHIRTVGTAVVERGLCKLEFMATDDSSGLAGVVLIRAGQVVADKTLKGLLHSGAIATYDYEPGVQEEWQILVLDRQGNVTQSSTAPITCEAGHNRAPVPFVRLSDTTIKVGQEVILDARQSFDPDGPFSGLKVQWDLDGDGDFDTRPSFQMFYRAKYSKHGVYQVVAKVTDEQGDGSRSMPIGIRIEPRKKARLE
jgi:hypothetical protein